MSKTADTRRLALLDEFLGPQRTRRTSPASELRPPSHTRVSTVLLVGVG